jgi:hypothetical protein
MLKINHETADYFNTYVENSIFGKCTLSFITHGDYISNYNGFPFNNDAIWKYKNEVKKILNAKLGFNIYLADKVTINNVAYEGLHFEVYMMHDSSRLSVICRGRKVGGFYSDGLTKKAREKLQHQINEIFFDCFYDYAKMLREIELQRYRAKSLEYINKAVDNLRSTNKFLRHGLDDYYKEASEKVTQL